MTDKLRSPSPAWERSTGGGTPMQDEAQHDHGAFHRATSLEVDTGGVDIAPWSATADPSPLPLSLRERGFTRRALLAGTAALAALGPRRTALAATEAETESHGLSTFGELKYPADFKHFDYVNPGAPKGGTLALQIKRGAGNQNFDTFNTLNIFVLKGDGAAGMDATFDSLMAGSGDDPDGLYGLLAHKVRWSADKLTYRFLLRPEARFHDGSRVTARDAAFSINILKTKGHPSYRTVLSEVLAAEAESDDVLKVQLSPKRSRDLHLIVGGNPVFSEAYWRDRDFEASTLEPPLASGPYKVGRFEQGRFIEFDRVPDYWGRDLPVNIGQNNFDKVRYEYFRDRQVAFEAFKSGVMNYHEEFTARTWATGYDFPAFREGRVKREVIDRACFSRSAARCRTRSSASPTCRRSPTAPAAIATSCAAPTPSCARPAASARAPSSSCRTASRSRSSSSTTRHRCSRIRSRSRPT